MTTGTKRKGPSKPRTPRAAPKPVEAPEVEEPLEDEWADEDSLPTGTYRDVKLPVMGRKVRVRMMSNVEATQLALIPDLKSFAALMQKLTQLQENDPTAQLDEGEDAHLRAERMRYMTQVAHFCVMKRGAKIGKLELCDDCGLDHPVSMWTTHQVRYLHPTDLAMIANTAERGWELERVRPLSRARTERPTSPPANTGESTQDATS